MTTKTQQASDAASIPEGLQEVLKIVAVVESLVDGTPEDAMTTTTQTRSDATMNEICESVRDYVTAVGANSDDFIRDGLSQTAEALMSEMAADGWKLPSGTEEDEVREAIRQLREEFGVVTEQRYRLMATCDASGWIYIGGEISIGEYPSLAEAEAAAEDAVIPGKRGPGCLRVEPIDVNS